MCGEICKEYHYCHETTEKCTHKGFFPMYPLELVQIVVFISSSAIATACGVGGITVTHSLLWKLKIDKNLNDFMLFNHLIRWIHLLFIFDVC